MASYYGVLLVAVLVLVSGLIAYVGDVVGRRMGRARMRLWGMRPRHTAIVVSVIFGMAITLFTLGSAMLISERVRIGFLYVDNLRAEQKQLVSQRRQLTAQVYLSQQRYSQASKSLIAAEGSLKQADAALAQKTLKLSQLERNIASAARSLAQVRAERDKERRESLGWAVPRLWRAEETARRLAKVYANVRDKPVIFRVGEPVDWTVVESGQSALLIRRQLAKLVGSASARALEAGAKPGDGGQAADASRVVLQKNGEVLKYTEQQVLSGLATTLARQPGSVVVRALAAGNTVEGEPVPLDFELVRNERVFRKGEVIVEANLPRDDPETRLLTDLVALLRKAGDVAREKGIMPSPAQQGTRAIFSNPGEAVGQVPYGRLVSVIGQIRQGQGIARVLVKAASDSWTAGPLEINLEVEQG